MFIAAFPLITDFDGDQIEGQPRLGPG